MPRKTPYSAYERTKVETADQRQLILMLYDGALRFMQRATAKIEANDIEGAHNYLIRTRDIISELLATLKPEKGGEIGENLKQLYTYMFNRLVEANLTKDTAIIREVSQLMGTLREGWASIKPAGAKSTEGTPRENRRVNVTG